jgi:hypothetical protein
MEGELSRIDAARPAAPEITREPEGHFLLGSTVLLKPSKKEKEWSNSRSTHVKTAGLQILGHPSLSSSSADLSAHWGRPTRRNKHH